MFPSSHPKWQFQINELGHGRRQKNVFFTVLEPNRCNCNVEKSLSFWLLLLYWQSPWSKQLPEGLGNCEKKCCNCVKTITSHTEYIDTSTFAELINCCQWSIFHIKLFTIGLLDSNLPKLHSYIERPPHPFYIKWFLRKG